MDEKPQDNHIEHYEARAGMASATDADERDPKEGMTGRNAHVADNEADGYVDPTLMITEEESKRMRRKIHMMVLPIMCVAYFCQSCDKGTLSPASIMGWRSDVGATGNDYALTSTVFYCGIILGEPLANQAVRLLPIAKFLGFCMCGWTVLVLGLTFSLHVPSVLAVRFLLGFLESAFLPALVSITVQWYTKEEQPFVTAVWQACFAIASVLMSFFGWAFYHIEGKPGGLRNWQWMTLTVAIMSGICSALVLLFLPDSPTRARWASEEYKVKLVERIRKNDQGLKQKHFKWSQVWEGAKDPFSYLLFLHAFLWSIPNGGVNIFNALLVNEAFKFDVLESQLLNMPVGALQAAMFLVTAWVIKKTKETCFTVIGLCVFPIVGSITLLCVEPSDSNRGGLLVAFYCLQIFQAVYPTIWVMLSRNVAGQSKKSVVYATTFTAWAAGQALGPQVFQAAWAPRYLHSLEIHLALYGALILTVLAERWLMIHRNKRKDAAQRDENGVIINTNSQAFEDLTDLENPDFRYSY